MFLLAFGGSAWSRVSSARLIANNASTPGPSGRLLVNHRGLASMSARLPHGFRNAGRPGRIFITTVGPEMFYRGDRVYDYANPDSNPHRARGG